MKVAIGTPVHWDPRYSYTTSLAALLLHKRDFELAYATSEGVAVAQGRTDIARDALEWGADWLLFIDADMTFPADGLERLLGHDLDVVGCNYVRRSSHGFTGFADGEELQPGSGVRPVESLGLGFSLIRSSVFDHIAKPWFHEQWLDEQTRMGEDVYFFHRVRQAGIVPHVDHDLSARIGHIRSGPAYLKDEPLHPAA
jgi:hypothetical protein